MMTAKEIKNLSDKEINRLYKKVWADIQRRARENADGYFKK